MKRYALLLLAMLALTGCEEAVPNTATSPNQQSVQYEAVTRKLELPFSQYSQPCWIDGKLYVGVNDRSEFINTLIAYDPETQKTERVYRSAHSESALHTIIGNERWLVFVDSNALGEQSTIYALERKTGKMNKITQSEEGISALMVPTLDGDHVAWVALDADKKAHVRLHHLAKGNTETVAAFDTFAMFNNFLWMQNGKLLWSDSANGKGVFKRYDLASKQMEMVEAQTAYPGYPKQAGDRLLALNFTDHLKWSSHTFGSTDPKTKQHQKLRQGTINRFETSGEYVAVLTDALQAEIYRMDAGELRRVNVKASLPMADTIDFTGRTLIIGMQDKEQQKSVFQLVDLGSKM